MTEIARSASDITVDWLKSALTGKKEFEGAQIEDISVEPIGNGVIARMARVDISYGNDSGAPSSIVVKFATQDPNTFGLAQAMGMYELETRFYQDIAPLMHDMPLARCYGAAYDESSGQFNLILEDLSRTTRTASVFTESTPAECEAALGALVKFQAPLWNSEKTAALPWLADARRTIGVFDALPAGLEPFLARLGSHLEPEHVALVESVLPQAGKWARSWSAPTVVQHGDFRSDNLLYGTSPTAPPVTVVDFQTVRLGPPGVDAAYFVGSALSTETRRNVERDLIAGYYKELATAGVTGFDFDACWASYCEGALYGVFLFVGMGSQVEASEHADRVMANQIKRYADMAIDLESAKIADLA